MTEMPSRKDTLPTSVDACILHQITLTIGETLPKTDLQIALKTFLKITQGKLSSNPPKPITRNYRNHTKKVLRNYRKWLHPNEQNFEE